MKIRTIAMIVSASLLLSGCAKIDEVSQKVMSDIDSIGTVEVSDQELIEKTEKVYATLTDKQKSQVNNYASLLSARDKLDLLVQEEEKRIDLEKQAAEEEKAKLFTPEVKFCSKAIVALRNNLKNPESIQVHAFSYSNFDSIQSVNFDISAQNSFGGLTRNCYCVSDTSKFGGYQDYETRLYCTDVGDIISSDYVASFDKLDDVDLDTVMLLLAEYDESKDISVFD